MRAREAVAASFAGFWFGKTAAEVATTGFFFLKQRKAL